MTCPRTPNTDCLHCHARPDEECPLADATPGLLTDAPITAGTVEGVCELGEECQSCQ